MDMHGSTTPPRIRHKSGNCSYADLIMMAISSSNDKQLTLAEIYDWMATNVPGLEAQRHVHSSKGWKNAVRHTLSINKRFTKIGRLGRPGWWTLEPSKNDAFRDFGSREINFSPAMVSFEQPLDDEPQSFRPRSYSEPQRCLSEKPVSSYNSRRKTSTNVLSAARAEPEIINHGQNVAVTFDDGTMGVMNVPGTVILQSACVCEAATQTDFVEDVIQQNVHQNKISKPGNETNFHYLSSFFDSLPSPLADGSFDTETLAFYDPKYDTYLN